MNMSRMKPRMRLEAVPEPTAAKFFRRDMRTVGSRRLAPLGRPRLARLAVESRLQPPPDRSFAGRIGDLVAHQIGHVEDVDHALAEGRDMRRGDVEIEVRNRPGEVVEKA